MDIYEILAEHQIRYQRCDHPPVFTVEEARRLTPPLPGAKTKNLFICDDKGKKHFLVVLDAARRIQLKKLAQVLNVKKVRLASPARLERCLGVTPGAVSLLAIVNDHNQSVEVVMDRDLWRRSDVFLCHPLVNTSTLVISRRDIERLVRHTGHSMHLLDLPTED